MKFPSVLLTLFAALCVPYASAGTPLVSGLPMENQAITEGQRSVFNLTDAQKSFLNCIRSHKLDPAQTPYVFRLTPQQSSRLEKESGSAPHRFVVYKRYADYDEIGPHWNVVTQFSDNEIEIPHKLLISDEQSEAAEFKQQGWLAATDAEKACGNYAEAATKPGKKSKR